MKQIHYSILIIVIMLFSCKKNEEKFGVIKGYVKHHEWEITKGNVYLKKDAIDFPGYNTANYDLSTTIDSDGSFRFTGLEKGNYYLIAKGLDLIIEDSIRGSAKATLIDNFHIVQINIEVAELTHE